MDKVQETQKLSAAKRLAIAKAEQEWNKVKSFLDEGRNGEKDEKSKDEAPKSPLWKKLVGRLSELREETEGDRDKGISDS